MIRRVANLTLLGLVIGSLVGALAVGFVEAVVWLNEQFRLTGEARESLDDRTLLTALTIGVPTAGGLLVGLMRKMIPGQRFHGPQEVIRIAQSPAPRMPIRKSAGTTIAAVVSLGSGASAGQYGPLAHMGAWIGSWFSSIMRSERAHGMISIACGCAAAISAAFHAPIAGLVFSREVILRHYSLRAFAPIAVASILGYVVAHIVFDREPLFRLQDVAVASPWEYLVFIVIGLTGAIVATAFMRAIAIAAIIAKKLRMPAPAKTALAGFGLGLVALQVPEVLGVGEQVLRESMAGNTFGVLDLAVIMLAKLLLTALCLGFGFAGGVFAPALVIGALYGALFGAGAEWLFDGLHSPVAVYAVCGMVAVSGPVVGAPLTAVLIIFELTQSFELATAALASVAFANLVGFRIYGRSYFDVRLQKRGYDLRLGRDKMLAKQRAIRQLIETGFTSVRADHPIREVRRALIRDKRSEAQVVDDDGRYIGLLTLSRLTELAEDGLSLDEPAGRYADGDTLVLHADDSVWTAMSKMKNFVGESIPVIDNDRLAGVLYESTIVGAYLDVLDEIRKEEHAAL